MIAAPSVPSELFRATERGLTTPELGNEPTEPESVAAPSVAGTALSWLFGGAVKDVTVWVAAMVIGLALVLLGLYLITRDLLPSPSVSVS